MTTKLQNTERAKWVQKLFAYLEAEGEDVGMIASNVVNLPTVAEDGTEYEIEITVKIPKSTEDNDCFAKRQGYAIRLAEKAEKAKEAEAKKQRKIEADQKRRAERAKAKEVKA